MNETALPNS